MNIILFGFKNSGKTFLGKLLALKLGRFFVDTDAEIEKLYFQQEKKTLTVREIFQKEGEDKFRLLEKETLFSLKNHSQAVIALGGGSLDEKSASFLMQIGDLFYLKASFELILKRIESQKLPAFVEKSQQPLAALQELFEQRSRFFQTLKAKEICADLLEDPENLQTIVSNLQKIYGK